MHDVGYTPRPKSCASLRFASAESAVRRHLFIMTICGNIHMMMLLVTLIYPDTAVFVMASTPTSMPSQEAMNTATCMSLHEAEQGALSGSWELLSCVCRIQGLPLLQTTIYNSELQYVTHCMLCICS